MVSGSICPKYSYRFVREQSFNTVLNESLNYFLATELWEHTYSGNYEALVISYKPKIIILRQ